VRDEVLALYEDLQFHTGLDRAFTFIRSINRYAEVRAPWSLGKASDDASQDKLRTCLATMAESLRVSSALLEPVMPTIPGRIRAALGLEPDAGTWRDRLEWNGATAGRAVAKAEILFPRGGP
jgi:methionyl-tRNA synthetase